MIVADVSFGDIFWSVLWFFFLFIWIMILFHILTDLFRDHSVSGVEKTLWVLFLVFLPFLAVFIFLLVRGKGMGERAAAQQQRAQQQFEGYVRNVATTGETTPTEQIAKAKELLDTGAIDQSEFVGGRCATSGPAHAAVVAEALGRHELVVAAHVDNATVGESHDGRERSWAILGRCASPRSQRLVAGCAAFHAAPVTTHHAQPEPHQRPK